MPDIAEQICLAVDQIVTERLKSINYDTTIVATVVSDQDADQYKYICTNGSAQFVAFSKDQTYKEGDSVQVTIPNNDYDQQKIIIGKYVIEDSTPYVFVEPFETFIDVSTNLASVAKQASLLANKDIVESINEDGSFKYTNNQIFEIQIWSNYFEEGYKGFNRLGLKGQFKSWINNLKTVFGDYGYRLEIFSTNGDLLKEDQALKSLFTLYQDLTNGNDTTYYKTVLKAQSDDLYKSFYETFDEEKTKNDDETYFDWFLRVYESALLERKITLIWGLISLKVKITNLYLSSTEMYGNPYNFQSYFEQEKVYDISSLGNIVSMALYFYEESGTFKNESGEYVPYFFGKDLNALRPNNLFTKDPYVCLGYDLAAFDKEQAILYSMDSDYFLIKDQINPEENWKTIRLRWLHEFESGNIGVVSEATTDVLPYDAENNPDGYEIRWYQYTVGTPSADEYCGAFWKKLPKAAIKEDGTLINELTQEIIGNEDSYVDFESDFNCCLRPRTNKASEQIKVIILYNNNIIRSNILTFTNQDENGVSSAATASTVAGLSLWCEDGSYGNYFVYGQNNKILETEEFSRNKILTLQAKFADASLLAEEYDIDEEAPLLTEAKEIIWEFPLNSTMIEVEGFNYDYLNSTVEGNGKYIIPNGYLSDAIVTINTIKNTIQIKRLGDSNSGYAIKAEQNYKIKEFYNQTAVNNTITCSVLKNNMLYTTTKEFSFGLRGTTGAEATLVLDFNNNKTALTANATNEALVVTAHLYDSAYKEIDFKNQDYNLTCDWNWAVYYQDFASNKFYDPTGHSDLQKYAKQFIEIQREEINNQMAQTNDDAVKQELAQTLGEWDRLLNYVNTGEASEVEKAEIENILNNYKPDILLVASQDIEFSDITFSVDETLTNVCTIQHINKLLDNNGNLKNYLLIIQVTVKNWQEERSTEYTQGEKQPKPFNSDLVAQKAIPIRYDTQFRNITGPTEIIYDSSGNISYTKTPFEIYGRNDLTEIEKEKDFFVEKIWSGYVPNKYYIYDNGNYILSTDESFDSALDYYEEKEYENISDENEITNEKFYTLVYDTSENQGITAKLNESFPLGLTWKIFNPFGEKSDLIGTFKTETLKDDNGNPIEDENGNPVIINANNILRPAPIYTESAMPYGVVCYADLNWTGTNFQPVWIQPLIVAQNRYPSATLNAWDGKTIELNSGEGYIVSPAIAAGKKNTEDNTFSGVMLGDWSNLDTEASISKQTGLYGFHHGAQTFAFKEDGTAFIGKSGHGRILFDGNTGVLKSSAWTDANETGMFLDLDDGVLKLQKNSQYDRVYFESPSDYVPGKYYIFQTQYFEINYGETWSSQKDYYLFSLQNLGNLSKNEFLTKLKNYPNDFYKENIENEEVTSYEENAEYLIDGYSKVDINKTQYEEGLSSKKYYILNEEFTLAPTTWSSSTTYYTKYQEVAVSESLYNTYYADVDGDEDPNNGMSTKYYVESVDANGVYTYTLSKGPYSEIAIYFVEEYTPETLTESVFNKNTSKKYYIKEKSEYIISTDAYSASETYYMENKIEKDFNNIEEFNSYLAVEGNKIYKIIKINYSLVKNEQDYSEIGRYAQYLYVQSYYSSTGPTNTNWNQVKGLNEWEETTDPNLYDNIRYFDENGKRRHYYTLTSGYVISNDPYDNNKTYYTWNDEAQQRFITLSAQEPRYPLSIGTTSSVAKRKFRVEWDGTVWIENGNISGIINADELYCNYGFIGGWEIDSNTLSGGKTILDSSDGIYTNKISIVDQISSKTGDGLLGEIGLIYGSTGQEVTYNIGITSLNQSIVLDTMQAQGSTSNIALRSKTGAWAQCENFYIMGNTGWQSKASSTKIFADKVYIDSTSVEFTADADNQKGIYARFA